MVFHKNPLYYFQVYDYFEWDEMCFGNLFLCCDYCYWIEAVNLIGYRQRLLHPQPAPAHSTLPCTPTKVHQLQIQIHTRSFLAKTKLDWSYLCNKNTVQGVPKRSNQLLNLHGTVLETGLKPFLFRKWTLLKWCLAPKLCWMIAYLCERSQE